VSCALPPLAQLLAELVAIPSVSGAEQALGRYVAQLLQGCGMTVARQPLVGCPGELAMLHGAQDRTKAGPAWPAHAAAQAAAGGGRGPHAAFPGEARAARQRCGGVGRGAPGAPLSGERFNVVADSGGEGPAWLLAGHLDTVPVAACWAGDPFRLRHSGRRASGLGAWDMKGGLAALLQVASRWQPGHPRLKLAFLADEEWESAGSHILVHSGFLDGVGAALVPEAGGVGPAGAARARLALVLGRTGRVLLEVELRGRPVHGAVTGGSSALLAAARAALAAGEAPTAHHPRLGRGRAVLRELHSGSQGALTVPEQGWLQLDRLLVPPETAEDAAAGLAAFLAGQPLGAAAQVRIVPRQSPYLEAYTYEPEHPLVRCVSERLAGAGVSAGLCWDPSPADENRLVMAGIPALSLCPVGGEAHEAEEWVDMDSLEELTRGLTAIVAGPPPPRS